MKKAFALAGFCCWIAFAANAQYTGTSPKGYEIDSAMVQKFKPRKSIQQQSGRTIIWLDAEWLEDDKLIDIPVLTGKQIPYYVYDGITHSETSHDSVITSIGLIGMMSNGVGILIKFHPDSTRLFHVMASRDPLKIFKHNATDREYVAAPAIPSASYKLILSSAPQPGKPVEGYVEYESKVFYQKSGGRDMKRLYKLKGYFRSSGSKPF